MEIVESLRFEQPIPAAKAKISATYFHNDIEDTYQFDLATYSLFAIEEAPARVALNSVPSSSRCDNYGSSPKLT